MAVSWTVPLSSPAPQTFQLSPHANLEVLKKKPKKTWRLQIYVWIELALRLSLQPLVSQCTCDPLVVGRIVGTPRNPLLETEPSIIAISLTNYEPVKSNLKHLPPRAFDILSYQGEREFDELSFPWGGAFDHYS